MFWVEFDKTVVEADILNLRMILFGGETMTALRCEYGGYVWSMTADCESAAINTSQLKELFEMELSNLITVKKKLNPKFSSVSAFEAIKAGERVLQDMGIKTATIDSLDVSFTKWP